MKPYEADYICSKCGKVLINKHAEYSLYQWKQYYCRDCSPDTMKNGAPNPFKEKTLFTPPVTHVPSPSEKADIARIASEKEYLKEDPDLLNIPF